MKDDIYCVGTFRYIVTIQIHLILNKAYSRSPDILIDIGYIPPYGVL